MNLTFRNKKSDETSLARFLLYYLRLGTFGFGGPIALASRMESDLVRDRNWISQDDYLEGLAFAQLAPGPLAAQLAMYLGYVKAGIPGATLVGFVFILPSFLMVLAISALYVRFDGLPQLQAVFYGIGAAVVAIILRSATKLGKSTLKRDPVLWSIAAVLCVSTAVTGREIFWLFLLGALTAGIFWIGIYIGVSYFLGEEIAKLVGKIGTKALIGVIVLVVVGLLIRAGVSKWRGARQARLAD